MTNMNMKPFALIAVLPLSMLAVGTSYAQPKPKPPATVQSTRSVTLVVPTKLHVGNNNGEPGEWKQLYATLTAADGTPLAGKAVTMAFEFRTTDPKARPRLPILLKSSMTDEKGTAKWNFAIPDVDAAPAGTSYVLVATYAGDAHTQATKGEGSFGVMKGEVYCVMGASSDGAVSIKLERRSDRHELPKSEKFTVTVNNGPPRITSSVTEPLSGNGPWLVKTAYKGSAMYRPCAQERKYTNSSETHYTGPH